MEESIRKQDIKQLIEEKIEELKNELRKTIIEEIDKGSSKAIAAIFSESSKIREEIGYQTMMLKILGDNLSEIQFDDSIGVSSKIELSIGGEIFGTGAKWILDIDVAKASYKEILKAIQLAPGIPNIIKEKVKLKLQKLSRLN